MKKYISLLIMTLFVGMTFGADVTSMIMKTADLSQTPNDIKVLTLYDTDTARSSDTMTTTNMVVSGPFSMTGSSGEPAYKGFYLHAGPIAGTSPTAAIAYQLTMRHDLSDTVTANFVTFDTLTATGAYNYIDLSSKAGRYIWFRIDNWDNTETQISGRLEIGMKRNMTYNLNK